MDGTPVRIERRLGRKNTYLFPYSGAFTINRRSATFGLAVIFLLLAIFFI